MHEFAPVSQAIIHGAAKTGVDLKSAGTVARPTLEVNDMTVLSNYKYLLKRHTV